MRIFVSCAIAVFLCMSLSGLAQQHKGTAVGYINFDQAIPSGVPYWLLQGTGGGNSWQVGAPQKPVFSAANSIPRVIVTDTLNSYPNFEHSSFIIGQKINASQYQFRNITAYYQVHSDTLVDYGMIEVSVDKGQNWIDAINDVTYNFFDNAFYNKPILSGNSGGWKTFAMNLSPICNTFNLQTGDTVLIRFSFHSDGNQTGKDGLMYDDISLADKPNSIGERTMANSIPTSAYPNPAQTHICIAGHRKYDQATVQLYTAQGICTGSFSFTDSQPMKIGLHDHGAGLYYYRVVYDGGEGVSDGRFMVE